MVRDIDVLNDEMESAGARFFAGGLQFGRSSQSTAPLEDVLMLVEHLDPG
jgi:hypothetical protein